MSYGSYVGRSMACDECGGAFPTKTITYGSYSYEQAPRYDARYCSNRCRQKAYRKRKKEADRKAAVAAEMPGQLGIAIPNARPASRSRHRAPANP